jgi:hypothetical protein
VTAGTRLAIGALLFGLAALGALSFYGRDSLLRREPDSPATVAREMVQADNTVVGLIGAIRSFEPSVTRREVADSSFALVEARVLGARDSGHLAAEMAVEAGRWTMRSARFTLSDGTTIPVAGSAGR